MIIYCITNLINNKKYVGQTINTNLKKRWGEHSGPSRETMMSRAIQKYGKENFYIEQIDSATTLEELNLKEILWIDYLDTYISFGKGYNVSFGGKGFGSLPEEIKKKISASKLGIPRSEETKLKMSIGNKGRKASDEVRRKMSIAQKKRIERTGKIPCSEETKKKISIANKGRPSPQRGIPLSDETKKKISIANKGKKLGVKRGPMSAELKQKLSNIKKGKAPNFTKEQWESVSKKLSGTNNYQSKISPTNLVEIKNLLLENQTPIKDIAQQFNVSQNCIRGIRAGKTYQDPVFQQQIKKVGPAITNKRDILKNPFNRKGSNHPGAKLNFIQISRIKWLLNAGFSCSVISRYYSIRYDSVNNIKNKQTYTNEPIASNIPKYIIIKCQQLERKIRKEHSLNLSKSLKGKNHTKEHRARLSESKKGKKGKPHSIESKIKMSQVANFSKLNEKQVADIKYLLNNGYSTTVIANYYSVYPGAIYKIKKGFSWAYVIPATKVSNQFLKKINSQLKLKKED